MRLLCGATAHSPGLTESGGRDRESKKKVKNLCKKTKGDSDYVMAREENQRVWFLLSTAMTRAYA